MADPGDGTASAESTEGLADLLVGIQRLIRRRLRAGQPGPRLRGAQVELLRLVADRPGIGVAAAARELHLAGNSVSTLVNQSVAGGLLTRDPDPGDRRAVRLAVTAEAVERLAAWDARRGDLVSRHVDGLPESDRAALAAALPALRRLAELLHDETEGTP